MARKVILDDHAPELEGVIGSALWPGGQDQPGRMEGERTLEEYYGRVLGWFTVQHATSTGNHPDFARQAWAGVSLPVRADYYDPDAKRVRVLLVDAFNSLTDNKVPPEALQYWADVFSSMGTTFSADALPTAVFEVNDGVLEPNNLLVNS